MEEQALTPAEIERYSRQVILPELGLIGQTKLKNSSVLVIGAGGLGSPVLLYLAAAGVGRIGIVDDDRVDVTNLQRQILYGGDVVGQSKATLATARLQQLNEHIQIEKHERRFSAQNALALVKAYDLIIDGSDNFATRYVVNDACVLAGKPNVHGAIYRFEGQVSVFSCAGGPCYRCLFPDPPPADAIPNCAEGGVLGVVAGTIGLFQATEALKLLLGRGSSLIGKLLIYDAMNLRIETLTVKKNPQCPICGERPTILAVADPQAPVCSTDEGNGASAVKLISAADLASRLKTGANDFCLLDVRNDDEFNVGHIEGAKHIPLGDLSGRFAELATGLPLFVYCKSGKRSEQAARMLLQNGFGTVFSLDGGIVAWSKQVDGGVQVL
jgi:molybdopterin/thiamine biosynthesis adenylyltransferase/rhodanese-related sulfurtransferase